MHTSPPLRYLARHKPRKIPTFFKPKTYPTDMKKWFGVLLSILMLVLASLTIAQNAEDIKLNSYVNDYADVFTPTEEQELYAKLDSLKQQGVAEFAIVTINSLEGRDIESYSLEVAQGHLGNTEKNNGL